VIYNKFIITVAAVKGMPKTVFAIEGGGNIWQ